MKIWHLTFEYRPKSACKSAELIETMRLALSGLKESEASIGPHPPGVLTGVART
jgi:hypothetical protein